MSLVPASSHGGSSPFLTATATVSSAQLLNAFTSPVTLIAAPGPNKLISVVSYVAHYKFGTTPYTDPNGTVGYYGGPSGTLVLTLQPIDGATVDSIGQQISNGAEAATLIVNQPIVLVTFAANMTGGDGTFEFTIDYTVVTLT